MKRFLTVILAFTAVLFVFSCSSGTKAATDDTAGADDTIVTDDQTTDTDQFFPDADGEQPEEVEDTEQSDAHEPSLGDTETDEDNLSGDDDGSDNDSASVTKGWTKQWGTISSDDAVPDNDSTGVIKKTPGEEGTSVAVDSIGNIYVTGYTNGELDGNTNAGGYDIFLTKWNADGTKVWTKQWGTSDDDDGNSVVVDNAGNVYVTGRTGGDLDGNTSAGDDDIFLTKWNADGTKSWSKQWGTSNWDGGSSVALDSTGNIYVTGYTRGAFDGNMSAGNGDIFLTKWNAAGTKAWTKQWGTSGYDRGTSVAVDNIGNIYVTGYTYGDLDGNTSAGNDDIFLTKWNPDGTKVWTKQWGTSGDDDGNSVVVDNAGNVYVTGYTYGDLDGNTSAGGDRDIFLTKWNADGTKVWTKQWGTSGDDNGNSVVVDSTGNIYVTGYTDGDLDENTSAGDDDIFLTKRNADGTKAWNKQWGTSGRDRGSSVALDSTGNIYVSGRTEGDLDENTSAGDDDIFLTKWIQ